MGKFLNKKFVSDNITLGRIIACGLTLIERGRVRIAGLSLTVRAGEIVGLVGDPGSGKSRSLALIEGAIEPTFGMLRLCGAPVNGIQSISVIGPDITANGAMSVDRWLDEFYNNEGLYVESLRARIRTVLGDIGWGELISRQDGNRGLAERTVLGLATAIAIDSPVILVDEPMKGLTVVHAKYVWKILRDMSDAGKAVLISVDPSDLGSVDCDRLYLIENGLITRRGSLLDIRGSLPADGKVGGLGDD
jgi:ABC-2 type transport system ATP-binding protein/sodium transport system ATP-binding protein